MCLLTGCGEGPSIPFTDRGVPASQRWQQMQSGCGSTGVQIVEEGVRHIPFSDDQENGVLEAHFATGTTCIERPLKQVWAVLHSIAGVSWDGARAADFTPLGSDERMDYRFKVRHKAFFVEWWIGWDHRLIKGDSQTPEQVQIQFYKIGKAKHIDHWSGEILLGSHGNSRTSVLMDIELSGTRIDMEKVHGAIHTQFDRLREHQPDFQYFR